MNDVYLRRLAANDPARRLARTRRWLCHPWRACKSRLAGASCAAPAHAGLASVRTIFGDRMWVTPPEWVSTRILRDGFWEMDLSTFFLSCLRPGMVVYDIGAHLGYFSLLASRLVGPAGRVHAFEPSRATVTLLRRNVGERANVVVNDRAVWSRPDVLTLHDCGESQSSLNTVLGAGEKPLASPPESADSGAYAVQAVSVDAYAEDRRALPDFVKVDAEGAEPHVLQGMERTFGQHPPFVTLEVGDGTEARGALPSRDLVTMMRDYGYRPFGCEGRSIRPHVPRTSYTYGNLLFVPPKRNLPA